VFLTFRVVFYAVLLVAGLWWCKEMVGRFRDDLRRLKEGEDKAEKGVILFLWGLTVVIALLIARFVLALARGVAAAF